MTAPRCEPPEEWRGRDGWHWVRAVSGQLYVMRWRPDLATNQAEWGTDIFSPAMMYKVGHRYLAPVATPAEVEALRARVAELEEALSVLHEAAEMLLGGTGRIWGRGPEDADHYTHEPRHAEYLAEAEKTARVALESKP